MTTRRFHLSVRSALAAFLLLGGLQAVIVSAREPLGAGAIRLVNWFMDRIKADSSKLSGAAADWTYFWAEMVIGLALLALAVGIGAGVKSSTARGKNAS